MKTYTLIIKANECVLACSDGRRESFQTSGRNDARIVQALLKCKLAGVHVTATYA